MEEETTTRSWFECVREAVKNRWDHSIIVGHFQNNDRLETDAMTWRYTKDEERVIETMLTVGHEPDGSYRLLNHPTERVLGPDCHWLT